MSRTVIAMGLQEVGKTTFLAALWDVLNSGDVPKSLKLERTEGDMQYLSEIRELWADYRKITRTGPASDKSVVIRIRDENSSLVTELAWTDMLGERFQSQWTDRAWTRPYQQLVDTAVGIVLFVHPRRVNESPLIADAQRLLDHLPKKDAEAPKTAEQSSQPAPFNLRDVQTQVQLVDLLQLVDQKRPGDERLRLSLVVSAWDLIERTSNSTPATWLERRLPLLQQYLSANDDRFDVKVFGISSQGCDYSHRKTVARMQKALFRSSDRIKVVFDGAVSHDITAPVLWAIGGALS